MPRPRARSIFELGGHWISTIPGKRGLYDFWTDASHGGTRRRSLGTEDIEEAKLKLAENVLRGAPAGSNSPLSIMLENYFIERTDKLPSKRHARDAGVLILEYWGNGAKARDVTEAKQRGFALQSVEKGHSLGYIARTLSVLGAALRHGGLVVKIVSEALMRNIWKITAKPRRKVPIPSDDTMALILLAPKPESLERWLTIAMATGCRPEAAVDLAPAARIRDAQAIDLNPEGRSQNKKHRPIVKCPPSLTEAMDRWEREGITDKAGRYCGYTSVDSVDTVLLRHCTRLGIPKVSVYSIRHKVTTVMRAAGVPGDQISRQLGHLAGKRITEGYGEFSPDYQREATASIEAWVRRLRAMKPVPQIALKSHQGKAA